MTIPPTPTAPIRKLLIVNADDFGLSDETNRGMIVAHERGIVTSASLMVRGAAVEAAVEYARARPAVGLGLHVDLCEWAYRGGEWVCLYEVVPITDSAAIAREVNHQISTFRQLVGRDPTHLDSHQHVHRDEPVLSTMKAAANQLGVVLRHFDAHVQYCGDFYGQTARGEPYHEAVTIESLKGVIASLPPGITELCCHPGNDLKLDSMYVTERLMEVATLCDPRVREALDAHDVQLTNFAKMSRRAASE